MKPEFFRYSRTVALGAIAAAAMAACGGGSDDAPIEVPPATAGTINVAAMTNAPSCGFDEVNISIARIRFHQDFQATAAASGWTELTFSPARKVNLLNAQGVLSGATMNFGDLALPPGIYTQMRLVIETPVAANQNPNTIKLKGAAANATPVILETPASLASEGLKLPIDLKVESGQKANVVFDFDACNAVQPRGTAYVLRPSPRVVPSALNGITGYVDKAVLASDVVITAQQGGIRATTTVPNPTTGEFMLPRLAAGNYDVVVTAKGRTTTVVGQVPVTAGTTVAVSTVAAPIAPTTSVTSTISGNIGYAAGKLPPDTGTWVAASQSINAVAAIGNPVTVINYRFQPVDQATGNYTLADLPRSSLRYALYKPALPLTFANIATTPAAGIYRIEAVASGYSRVSTFGTNSSGVPNASATAAVNATTTNPANVNIIFY